MPESISAETPYRVLIAHQSTIPHYRIRFYELLEQMRPKEWTFDVVFDIKESENPGIYTEPVDYRNFKFPIVDARTRVLKVRGHKLIWQQFFAKAMQYDFIVTDTHITNLTYPATSIYRLLAKKWILWGHPRDMNSPAASVTKRVAEAAKNFLIKRSSAFFAYTDSGKFELIGMGYDPERIFVLNNTIDVQAERDAYVAMHSRRERFREQFGVAGKKVLLYVGRLIAGKRVELLLDAFEELVRVDADYRLLVVGSGDQEPLVRERAEKLGSGMITAFGAVTDRFRLAPIFIASDLYLISGMVGLAPLQAISYDLPVVYLHLPSHGPEIDYLNADNSAVLPEDTTSTGLAEAIPGLFDRLTSPEFRASIFDTIAHLTVENMAANFISGINAVCELSRPKLHMDID